MESTPTLSTLTLVMTRLVARYRWLHAPAGLLLVLLQRTPLIRVATMAEFATGTVSREGMKLLFSAAALGAYNTMAGATTFSVTPASPASGPANTTFTVDGTVGTALSVSFTVTGAPGNPRSWSSTGALPGGVTMTGGNPVNVSAPYKMTIAGTPTAAGNTTVTVTAWDTAGAKGNNASIKCLFRIAAGTVTNVAPSISTQPSALTVTAGSGATFSVTATGTPTPTYQWQKGGTAISGATGASYVIASAQAGDAGSYTVVVTNSVGTVTSSAATLTVNAVAVAPTISTQPTSQTVTAGTGATFSVTATGTPTPTYQWQKGGTAISGATSASYAITSAQAGDAGSYTVVVTNSAGAVTSSAATLTVNAVAVAPTISTQPTSQTVTAGTGATFSVTATGTPTPTYQWQKGGTAISGATSASYAIASAQAGDAGSYTVVVTNSAGAVTSSAATLTVNAVAVAPTISTQPASQTVTAGTGATFSVTATGTPTPTYQWQKGGTAISGATSASYAIASAQAGDAGSYTVVVANSAGSVTSSAATLTVNPLVTAPAITSQPQAVTVLAGSAASFSVASTGTPAPAYQWKKDGVNVVGATSASFSITSVQGGDAGSYTVVVTNSAGSVTSSGASLTVTSVVTAPTITTQPLAQTVTAGAAVSFAIATGGTAPFTYQWQKGGTAISGATSASYAIASAQASDAGSYTVVVANSAGSVTSSAATLTVNAALVAPTISTHPASQAVTAGSGVTFSVTATGTPTPTYQWQKGGTAISGATSASYAIASAQASDAGSYTVVVANPAGSVTSSAATLTVNALAAAPTISTQPASQSVSAGSGATFSVTATGTPTPTYQWQKGGTAIIGATGASYAIASAQAGDAGSYTVVVTNSAGSITSSAATLTVNAVASAPAIASQPASQTVNAGVSVSFTVTASGSPTPTYQWKKDGVSLIGATGSSHTIASATSGDAGNYTVVVTNSAGTVTSTPASLTVSAGTAAPSITSLPQSQSVTTGHVVSFSVNASDATSYQWEVSTDNGATWSSVANNTTYSGATTSQLTLTNAATTLNGALYRAAVTGPGGTVKSSPVALTVLAPVLSGPVSLGFDRSGNLLVADGPSNTCVTIASTGVTGNLAGLAGTQGSDDGSGQAARFRAPAGIVVGSSGVCYVADTGNSLVRMISTGGQVTTLAGSRDSQGYRDGVGSAAWFNAPADLAVDGGGNVYVADTGNSVIRRIAADGTVTTLAGTPGQRGSDNGTGAAARFNQPAGIVIDASGVLFVADTFNHTIRRVTSTGVVTTFTGSPGISGYDDGANALFNQPTGLGIDASGNLYVADSGNNTLRVINTTGLVRTLAGTPTVNGLEDGNGIHALLNQPKDVVLDAGGNLWVADYGNAAIRKVSPAGDVTTLALTAAVVPPPPVVSNPPSSSSSGSSTPTAPTSAPAEVGVGGGGGAVSNWFLLGIGALALLRRRRLRSHAPGV